MSTIDPVAAREERRRARRARGTPMIIHTIVMFLLGVSAICAGVAVVVEVDESRMSRLSDLFTAPEAALRDLMWTLPVGLSGVIMLSMLAAATAQSATGRSLSFPGVGPVPVIAVGLAAGVALAAPEMTPPHAVGVRIGIEPSEREPWNEWDWIWYRFDQWGPVLFAALALGAIIFSVLVRMKRSRRRASLRSILTNGIIVPGVVTEAPAPPRESSRTLGNLTVKFTDPTGTDRWVTQLGAFHISVLPLPGQAASVALDPAAPGDTRRIWAAPAGSRTEEDFLRWRINA